VASTDNPTPYFKILDISGKRGSQIKRMIKTGNTYSAGLYKRGVLIIGYRERELMWRQILTRTWTKNDSEMEEMNKIGPKIIESLLFLG